MKQIIIVCGDDALRCFKILQLITAKHKNAEIVLRVTTKASDTTCELVNSNRFWDMVEQGSFIGYTGSQDEYYGTRHINRKCENNQYMFNDVNMALEIKRLNPKVITIYVASQDIVTQIENKTEYLAITKLDFLVEDKNLLDTAQKIEQIVCFIEENGMKSS